MYKKVGSLVCLCIISIFLVIITGGCSSNAPISASSSAANTASSTSNTATGLTTDTFLQNFNQVIKFEKADDVYQLDDENKPEFFNELNASRVDNPDDKTVAIYVNNGIALSAEDVDTKVLLFGIKDDFIRYGKQLFDYYKGKDRIALYSYQIVKVTDKYGNSEAAIYVLAKLLLTRNTASKINWENLSKPGTTIQDDLFDAYWAAS